MSRRPVIVEATGLRAVFEPADDRWTHRIELTDTCQPPVGAMESLEGTADDAWPSSPVLQEVFFHVESDGTPAAMGIGKAGRNHWSLSCRAPGVAGLGDGGVRCLHFDVAARVRGECYRLGSCYRVVPEVVPRERQRTVCFQTSAGEWTVTASGIDAIYQANQTLRLDYFGEAALALPQTVRWAYRIARSGKTLFEAAAT